MTCRTVPAPRYGRSRPPTIREAYAAGQDPAPAPRIQIEPGVPRIGRLASAHGSAGVRLDRHLAPDGVDVTLPWVASSSRTMLGAYDSGPL
jgi:hypothetical protein